MFDQDVEKDLFAKKAQPSLGKETLRARCPECYKLYAIHTAEIQESRPQFACLDCKTKFWLPYPAALEADDIIMGFPMDWVDETLQPNSEADSEVEISEEVLSRSLSLKIFNCPKCEQPYAADEKECVKCGIIFSKFLDKANKSKTEIMAPKKLKLAWEALVSDYESFQSHQDFIALAQKHNAMDYAFEQYEKVLAVNPSDALAKRAQGQLSSLAIAISEAALPANNKFVLLPKMKLVNILYFLSAVIIAIGIFMPQLRNLVGFGSAILFTVLALRFYFRIL